MENYITSVAKKPHTATLCAGSINVCAPILMPICLKENIKKCNTMLKTFFLSVC